MDTEAQISKVKQNPATSFFDQVITASITLLFFGVPLFFVGSTWQGLAFEKQMYFYPGIFLALVAWLKKSILLGEIRFRRTPLDIPLLLCVIVYAASTWGSLDRWHSIWGAFLDPSNGLLSVCAFVAAYMLILNHFTQARLRLWLGACIASSFLAILEMWLAVQDVAFIPKPGFISASPIGAESASILFASALLPLFITVSTFVSSEKELHTSFIWAMRIISLLGIGMIVWLLFVLSSWVAWFSLLVGMGLFSFLTLSQTISFPDRWKWLPTAMFIILLIIFIVRNNTLLPGLFPTESSDDVHAAWMVARSSLKERMFLASGPGTYGQIFSLYRPDISGSNISQTESLWLRPYQAPGLFLEWLTTIGLVGTAILSSMLLFFLSLSFWLLLRMKEKIHAFSPGLFITVFMLGVGSLVVPVSSTILIFSVLLASLLMAVLLEDIPQTFRWNVSLRSDPRFSLFFAFATVVVFSGLAVLGVMLGKMCLMDIRVAQSLRSFPEASALEQMGQIVSSSTKEPRYATLFGQAYLSQASQEMSKPIGERNVEQVKTFVESANVLLQAARDRNPNDIFVQETLARSYELAAVWGGGDPMLLEQAQKEYERAAELEPSNPVFYMKLGQLKQARAASLSGAEKDALLAGARGSLEVALQKDPFLVSAYVALGLVEETAGDDVSALMNFEKSVELDFDKKDMDARFNLARLYIKRGNQEDWKKSEVLLQDVLRQNDQALNVHLNLGFVYEKTGQVQLAVQEYRKALSLLPQEPALETIRQRITKVADNAEAGRSNAGVSDIFTQEAHLEAPQALENPAEKTVSEP